MKKLMRYVRCSIAAAVFCFVAFIMVIVLQPLNWKLYAVMTLAITLITALLSGKARRKLKNAALIVENQILHIQPAVFQEQGNRNGMDYFFRESIEVFVSCFGILLDSKIIKFNQEGVRLRAVELGRDFISLTYGTDEKTHRTRLLHAKISDNELTEIFRKFRYETGIVPVIMH